MFEILTGTLTPIFIVVGGTFFLFYLRGFYVLHPKSLIKALFDGKDSLKGLNLALAGTLGVGNILGVVNAIRLGGEGAVFWMLFSSLFASALKYAEAFLAVKTGEKGRGGAYFYIEKAMGRFGRAVSVVYSLAFLGNTFSTGCVMQSAAAVSSLSELFFLPELLISFFLAISVFVSSRRGIGRISVITNSVVPIMSAIYVTLTVSVIFLNRENIPDAISAIFSSAFDKEGIIFGIGGFAFTSSVRYGFMRGLLSNEAGSGSSATAHATEKDTTPHRQGCMGIAEVFADTALMCTLTALALITSKVTLSGTDDIRIALSFFGETGGRFFSYLASLSVFVFGFATLVCYSGYADECFSYLTGGKTSGHMRTLLLFIYSVLIFFSPIIPGEKFLLAGDISLSVMTFLNVMSMMILTKKKALVGFEGF